jgi:NAD(P)-dependent dehydrogenase (short-subunit alcohol dehydrogenase family)
MDKKVALITGSSRGIGRGISIKLAEEGFHTIINGVKPLDSSNTSKGAFEVLNTIKEAGGTADFVQGDISKNEDRAKIMNFIDKLGRIDLLVNNAGIEPPFLDFLESSEDRYNYIMSVNLKGPFFITQQVSKKMISYLEDKKITKGRICFITSVQGYVVTRGAEYCMTKAALGILSKVFANRLGEYDIPVIEISPGVIHSDMTAPHKEKTTKKIESGRLITKRWGEAEDVAKVVSAFARGDLDYSTGERIEVGGGLGISRW